MENIKENIKKEKEEKRVNKVLTGNKLGFIALLKSTCGDPAASDASCLILIWCCELATEFDGDFLRPSISASIEPDFGKGLNLRLLCVDA